MMKALVLFCLLSLACFAQQPQTHDVLNPEPTFGANSKWVQGIGPGYWPTAGTGLTLKLTAGTSFCSGAIVTYAGGTLTMTNTTNYIYLNTAASCIPAVKTSTFTTSDIPVAVVVASAGAITAITDDRTWFFTASGCGTLTGDVTSSGCATTIANNAVTAAKSAVVLTRRTCMIVVGADNGSALANADLGPQLNQCFVPFAATVVEIEVMADAGTPNVIVQRSHLGSPTALLSGALATASAGAVACSNTGGTTGLDGTTTCTNTLQNTSVAVGDWIGLTSGTAGATAKRMSIAVTMTVN